MKKQKQKTSDFSKSKNAGFLEFEDYSDGVSYTPGTSTCGYDCHLTKEYGFVPECGCPIHD